MGYQVTLYPSACRDLRAIVRYISFCGHSENASNETEPFPERPFRAE